MKQAKKPPTNSHVQNDDQQTLKEMLHEDLHELLRAFDISELTISDENSLRRKPKRKPLMPNR